MRYVISGKWSRAERFMITDESGAPRFDVLALVLAISAIQAQRR